MHPLLITLHSARDDSSGGRYPVQIPQLDTPQASKESHNSIHNPIRISSVDLIAGGGAATKMFAPGGKHPRAAMYFDNLNRGVRDEQTDGRTDRTAFSNSAL